jgi:hypothetical protein
VSCHCSSLEIFEHPWCSQLERAVPSGKLFCFVVVVVVVVVLLLVAVVVMVVMMGMMTLSLLAFDLSLPV